MIITLATPAWSILRARGGSSSAARQLIYYFQVFSAHAEVVPPGVPENLSGGGILRARGGSSIIRDVAKSNLPYSPRTRR